MLILGCLLTGAIGYRLGLRSQKESAKRAARNEVLTLIDRIVADMPKDIHLFILRGKTGDTLNAATFGFSCQLSERSRLKINKTLEDYQALDISYSWPPTEGSPDMERVKKEYEMMSHGLKILRDEIKNAQP